MAKDCSRATLRAARYTRCVDHFRHFAMSVRRRSVYHQLKMRPRLLIGVAAGLAVFALLAGHVSLPTQWLSAWDVGATLYVALTLVMMARSTVAHMRMRAQAEDDGAATLLALILLGAVASLGAIVWELAGAKSPGNGHPLLSVVQVGYTFVISWVLVHNAFALHYAHEFYMALTRGGAAPLDFAECDEPVYADFQYFSFVIGMTSQTADIGLSATAMRRLVMIHGMVAFLFNTTLLALTVNVAATLLA